MGIRTIIRTDKFWVQWIIQIEHMQSSVEGVCADGVRIPCLLVDHDVVSVAKTAVITIG